MTRLHNDPDEFVAQALEGFLAVHSGAVRGVDGGVVRAQEMSEGQVAVVIGGGSGHYPAFAGVVGPGLAAGAVCGNIFTSPSAGQAYRVATAAEAGGGVLFSYGNYAGDVIHFGKAEQQLRAEGIDTRTVLVTDDIASAPAQNHLERRGIAGDLVVFKIAGAAAERGDGLDEVERLARLANERTRSLGVAFAGCTFPGADEPLFTVPEGMISIGLGIHGEPGIRDVPAMGADELAATLTAELLADVPADRGDRAVVLVNGLGTVKYEELFVLYRGVARELERAGVSIVEPECGELVTSLDMAGVSVTLLWLTEELEELWSAPAHTPAFRKGTLTGTGTGTGTGVGMGTGTGVGMGTGAGRGRAQHHRARASAAPRPVAVPAASARSLEQARAAITWLSTAQTTLHEHAEELGRLDAVAGDGDHGVGMTRGIDAALAAASVAAGDGLRALLAAAGEAWSETAGGTSGALWGAALQALGPVLDDVDLVSQPRTWGTAARAALETIQQLGKAQPGDKTMVDALDPFVRTLEERLGAGEAPVTALSAAADAATSAAEQTARLRPALGRARPLAQKSLGHPDPGATSLALVTSAVASSLAGPQQRRPDLT
ncbi:dihydroxyacetone kinase family protein [Ruania zhangjianzhongii]|uniref:dihydroxyacetone kinase family protein n=1 Tax=Ruania zhangjianzhongii TaxID=2603206 RepID=UPI0011CA1801|nr:dihydroxyacetone kinase family protein [Ruania zhangjianzhongii]